jgi:hypothetical protein
MYAYYTILPVFRTQATECRWDLRRRSFNYVLPFLGSILVIFRIFYTGTLISTLHHWDPTQKSLELRALCAHSDCTYLDKKNHVYLFCFFTARSWWIGFKSTKDLGSQRTFALASTERATALLHGA